MNKKFYIVLIASLVNHHALSPAKTAAPDNTKRNTQPTNPLLPDQEAMKKKELNARELAQLEKVLLQPREKREKRRRNRAIEAWNARGPNRKYQ